jgi:hypothetical protein
MSVVESVRGLFAEDGVRMGQDRVKPLPLTENEVYDVMSSYRRRLVVSYLVRDADGQATISDLAEYIAAVENGVDAEEDPTASQRKRVYVGLYQCHLPRLAEADVVDYDQDRGLVSTTDVSEAIHQVAKAVGSVSGGVPK